MIKKASTLPAFIFIIEACTLATLSQSENICNQTKYQKVETTYFVASKENWKDAFYIIKIISWQYSILHSPVFIFFSIPIILFEDEEHVIIHANMH